MRRILVSAYACEPLKGSEQSVGWNIVHELAKKNQVHVITRANNQTPIEKNLPIEIKKNIIFHYYDTPKLFKAFKNIFICKYKKTPGGPCSGHSPKAFSFLFSLR